MSHDPTVDLAGVSKLGVDCFFRNIGKGSWKIKRGDAEEENKGSISLLFLSLSLPHFLFISIYLSLTVFFLLFIFLSISLYLSLSIFQSQSKI